MRRTFFSSVAAIGLLAVLACVSASPMAGPAHQASDRVRHDRKKRQVSDEDVRNCDSNPPYLPDTVTDTSARVAALRNQMTTNGVNAYIIPSEDAHGSEYVASRDKRRAFISGLLGSAGLAVVTATEAKLWTDGRYFLQAEKEMDCQWDLMKVGATFDDPSSSEWLADTLPDGGVIGFDPTLMSVTDYENYDSALKAKQPEKTITLKSIANNLVDEIWADQPVYNADTIITILDAEKYTGETWQQKVIDGVPDQDSIRQQLQDAGEMIDALVITKLDEIAWLFNLRGADVPYNPMFVSYAIVTKTDTMLYLYDSDSSKRVPAEIKTHLNAAQDGASCLDANPCVIVKDYDVFFTDLRGLNDTLSNKIWISNQASYAVYEAVWEDKRYVGASPLLLMKAVKSETEALGMEEAHAMDSVALCNLGAWMQETVDNLEDPMKGDINVISEQIVMQKAIEYREIFSDYFRGLSFGTIAGFGPHGAIIHYTSTPETDVAITKASTFLLDSGGQYLQGTCDITRTFHFGTPTAFMKEAYTRVLLGSIDLAMTVFRTGIYGRDIDAIARAQLWSGGLDYNHGTGHGIGHFLNVHEGPARFSGSSDNSIETAIQTDMFLSDALTSYRTNFIQSNEPGYYEDGSFGIRIENVMRSIPAKVEHDFEGYEYMTFKMISLVPLEPNLIDFSMFNNKELEFYNTYNKRVRDETGARPELTAEGKAWMLSKTEPMAYTFQVGVGSSGQKTTASLAAILVLALLGVIHL